jgi:osmotically inducible lipoprotein OsmB
MRFRPAPTPAGRTLPQTEGVDVNPSLLKGRPNMTSHRSFLARFAELGSAAVLSMSLMACANMSPAARDTAIGATAGAVVGGVVTGTTTGAAVGAAVGGVIGNEVNKRK